MNFCFHKNSGGEQRKWMHQIQRILSRGSTARYLYRNLYAFDLNDGEFTQRPEQSCMHKHMLTGKQAWAFSVCSCWDITPRLYSEMCSSSISNSHSSSDLCSSPVLYR